MAKEINDADFQKEVLESDVPVLLDFWAPWCGPCKMLGPVMEKIGDELDGKVKVLKINVDDNPQTPGKYGITGIPTVIVFKDGADVNKFVGVQPEQVYKDAVS